ncbi:RNA polymerase sigma factor SigM, partial [Streptomyces sp. TRM76130]|nr:RNA polymerase sigma factor SigM [Streptomyces sp. TRM76130]
PVAEAARILDVPTGTVKSRCARGRARLLPLLTHLGPDRASGNGEPSTQRNRPQGTPVPPTTGPSDSTAVKGGGGRA